MRPILVNTSWKYLFLPQNTLKCFYSPGPYLRNGCFVKEQLFDSSHQHGLRWYDSWDVDIRYRLQMYHAKRKLKLIFGRLSI